MSHFECGCWQTPADFQSAYEPSSSVIASYSAVSKTLRIKQQGHQGRLKSTYRYQWDSHIANHSPASQVALYAKLRQGS